MEEQRLSPERIFLRQVLFVTLASLQARYRKTLMGFLWVILNPLIIFTVQCLVFSYVLKIELHDYALFLVTGLLPWIFLCQSIEMGTPVFVNSGRLLKSFPVHPMVYLTAQVTDNLVSFISAFLLAVIAISLHSPKSLVRLALLPGPLILLFVGALSLAWILAVAQVFFRDTRFIASFLLNVGYFLTPIFYPLEKVPENWRWLAAYNPFYLLISPFRILVYRFSQEAFLVAMFKSCAVAAFSLVIAQYLWKSRRNAVYFHL